ncbi:MAG: DUF2252 family protein [Myxococcales bacterium]|nr:DUF2252 family protein [Myxococcales bacterium]
MADHRRLTGLPDIHAATRAYEAWVKSKLDVVAEDLERKHTLLRTSPFAFLRGTYYRWAQVFPVVCPKLAARAVVPAVGDLHVENFGTWRDAEGRLAWGVNDFDEGYPLAWTADLVRLATSVRFAIADAGLRIDADRACASILAGYVEGLDAGGRPFVLAEDNHWLGALASGRLKKPTRFFHNLKTAIRPGVPKPILKKVLLAALPDGAEDITFARRVAGVGSLGRPRWVALAKSRGGFVAREAKVWLPSANAFLDGKPGDHDTQSAILAGAVRSPDPMLHLDRGWTVRRLSPNNARVELDELLPTTDAVRLLRAMGTEVANVHLCDRKAARKARQEIGEVKRDFLVVASEAMEAAVREDHRVYRRKQKAKLKSAG